AHQEPLQLHDGPLRGHRRPRGGRRARRGGPRRRRRRVVGHDREPERAERPAGVRAELPEDV
ncbi:MAG: hypothetical protein AVDCRST_MAG85-4142, partial [uncultured Solirubrobacteraceae bacterium]